MITFTRPTNDQVRKNLERVANAPFTYDAVGCVGQFTPPRFKHDEATFFLGLGEQTWNAAKAAIRSWAMFPSAMVSLVRLSDEIQIGTTVAVLCPALGVWAVCLARILSTEDSLTDGVHRFGFTYGTLPGHVECGDELFRIEWDPITDKVTYRIEAVSRPHHILCWLGYPYTRMMQAKFRRLSGESIRLFVIEHMAKAGSNSETANTPLRAKCV